MSLSITKYDSPIGPIEIHATDTAVSRVEFAGEQSGANEEESGERRQVPLLILAAARRASATGRGAASAGRLFRWRLTLLRSAPGPGRHPVSAPGLAAATQCRLRPHRQLPGHRPRYRQPQGRARRRRRQRPQPRRHHRPCHRIIGSGGRPKLTGYGGGLWRKEWLLRHEGVLLV